MQRRPLKTIVITMAAVAILAGWRISAQAGDLRLFGLARGTPIAQSRALKRLGGMRIVLVGEHHDNADHHQAQLQIIRALHQAGRKVAMGLEMFRGDSQADLDRWVDP
jgi:uncharacterized iron-regulated protein